MKVLKVICRTISIILILQLLIYVVVLIIAKVSTINDLRTKVDNKAGFCSSKDSNYIYQYGRLKKEETPSKDTVFIQKIDNNGKLVKEKTFNIENEITSDYAYIMEIVEKDDFIYCLIEYKDLSELTYSPKYYYLYKLDKDFNISDKNTLDKKYSVLPFNEDDSILINQEENSFNFMNFNGSNICSLTIQNDKDTSVEAIGIVDDKLFMIKRSIVPSLSCMDLNGNVLWTQKMKNFDVCVFICYNGKIIIAGNDMSRKEAAVIVYDYNGTFIDEISIVGEKEYDKFFNIQVSQNGIYVYGSLSEYSSIFPPKTITEKREIDGTSFTLNLCSEYKYKSKTPVQRENKVIAPIKDQYYSMIKVFDNADDYNTNICFFDMADGIKNVMFRYVLTMLFIIIMINYDITAKVLNNIEAKIKRKSSQQITNS